jgi:predicted transcriptional regulator
MTKQPPPLSKRERQIMDIVYRLERATAADVERELMDAPTYTTVRGLLRVLEEKGHLRHVTEGTRYVFLPCTPRDQAGRSILAHVVRTFFDGSPANAMAALLGGSAKSLTDEDLARMTDLLERSRDGRERE